MPWVAFYRCYAGVSRTLCEHQGDDTASGAYIGYVAHILSCRSPCAQQHRIRANAHAAAGIRHRELFEAEKWSLHVLLSVSAREVTKKTLYACAVSRKYINFAFRNFIKENHQHIFIL